VREWNEYISTNDRRIRMNARLALLAIAALAVVDSVSASPAIESADATLRRYSAAINAGDCESVVRLTSEAVLRRDRLPGEFRSTMCPMLADWHAHHVKETIGDARTHLVDGWRQLMLVRASRVMDSPEGRQVIDFDYVVHSSDGGATCRVLDLGCLDERWVKEVFPAYAGEPVVHAAATRIVAR
jgi:hypothetical protein